MDPLADRVAVQAAYNRTDQLDKRHEMTGAWAQHLEAANVKVANLYSAKQPA
jgi:hypothetical protein